MAVLRWLIDRAFGVPTQVTSYRPAVPDTITNIGAACWTIDDHGSTLRMFARKHPPASMIIFGGVLPSCIMAGLIVAVVLLTSHNGNAKVAITLASLAGIIAFTGIWAAVLWGNWQEAQLDDLLRCGADGVIELPRSATRFPRSELLCVELAVFGVEGAGNTTYIWHLLLVRQAPGGGEQFELLLGRGGSLRKLGTRLAQWFGVPMAIASAGRYDTAKSQWIV